MRTVSKSKSTARRGRYKMNDFKYLLAAVVSLFAIVIITAALLFIDPNKAGSEKAVAEEKDPHEGQVYIYDGFDWIWMTPLEGVPVNEFTENDFALVNRQITYTGDKYTALRGIDVSEHQKEIDWVQVKQSGIDYAYIRVGRRGYTQGGLFDDEYFEKNINEAEANGIKVGVYMFSQAISVEEAVEEANFVLEKVRDHQLFMPVAYDWEKIEDSTARTSDIGKELRTECAVAFCETVQKAGYPAAVYFNRNLGYYGYDLTKLTDYSFWFSLPESSFPNFYYAVDMWQYSFTETVPGIAVETDMNLWFVPNYPEEQEQLPIA